MYEYCIWRRDEYVASCEAFPTVWEEAVEQVGCKKEKNGTCIRLNEKVAFTRHPGSTFEANGRTNAERNLSRTGNWNKLARFETMADDLIEFADGTRSFEAGCDAFYEFVDPDYEGLWDSGDEGEDGIDGEDSEDGEDGEDSEDGSNVIDGGDEGADEGDEADGEGDEGDTGECEDLPGDGDGYGYDCNAYEVE